MEDLIGQYGCFQDRLLQFYTYQLIRGVDKIHKRNIVHGNLKSSNIFANVQKKELVLSDFRIFNTFNSQKITPHMYKNEASAPEILLNQAEATWQSDI